ncbi:hypothetical protein [Thiomicrorhabdus sp.]|uniref:hypothetical protein n=1 Tax=Thiomicrorhabdus sp. TaxID=2039724 RepID=UPI0029C6B9B2|nr:hypothetical protein [Thiomicrorhabdus sp.]
MIKLSAVRRFKALLVPVFNSEDRFLKRVKKAKRYVSGMRNIYLEMCDLCFAWAFEGNNDRRKYYSPDFDRKFFGSSSTLVLEPFQV